MVKLKLDPFHWWYILFVKYLSVVLHSMLFQFPLNMRPIRKHADYTETGGTESSVTGGRHHLPSAPQCMYGCLICSVLVLQMCTESFAWHHRAAGISISVHFSQSCIIILKVLYVTNIYSNYTWAVPSQTKSLFITFYRQPGLAWFSLSTGSRNQLQKQKNLCIFYFIFFCIGEKKK